MWARKAAASWKLIPDRDKFLHRNAYSLIQFEVDFFFKQL